MNSSFNSVDTIVPTEAKRYLLGLVLFGSIALLGSSGLSCIIPDKGIIVPVDCGARWCATAELAEALLEDNAVVQVQEGQPDGTATWPSACICMRPDQDIILRTGGPAMQYDLLNAQVMDAARQRCIDVALANGLDPDPPPPLDAQLDPSCTTAVTAISREGCCPIRSDQCSGFNTCELGGTGGDPDPTDDDSADGDSSGELASLEAFYDQIECSGDTCQIGQALIDAVLHEPEALLAEGTSVRLSTTEEGTTGALILGVEPGGLAWRLGLREGDMVLQIDGLPLRSEADLWATAAHAYDAESVTLRLRHGEQLLDRHWLRVR